MDRVAKQKRKRKEGSRGKRKRGQRQQLREPLCTCARVCLSSCLAPATSSVRQCRLCLSLLASLHSTFLPAQHSSRASGELTQNWGSSEKAAAASPLFFFFFFFFHLQLSWRPSIADTHTERERDKTASTSRFLSSTGRRRRQLVASLLACLSSDHILAAHHTNGG
jgi:hypothetical protein